MTIGLIIRVLSTLDQYLVLQRADIMFRGQCGRYYGGRLTSDQINVLTAGIKEPV